MATRHKLALGFLGVLLLAGLGSAAAPPTADARSEVLSFNTITGNDPLLGVLSWLGGEPELAKSLVTAAAKLAKEEPTKLGRNTAFLMALVAESQKQTDVAITLYKLYSEMSRQRGSERGELTAALGIIQVNQDAARHADTEKACRAFLGKEVDEENPDAEAVLRAKESVFRRMVIAILRQGATNRALKEVDEAIERDDRNWLHHALKAQVLREADRNEDAAKVYLDLIEKIGTDERLEKDVRDDWVDEHRYTLSGVYVDMGKIDKAEEQLRTLLAREPNNPTYNNDLGFIMADNNRNLPEAEKLIRKAIAEERKLRKKLPPALAGKNDRDNAAYVDSLAWVLFKQGKAKEAKPLLLEAIKDPEGQHLEILDHLGDVLMALGEKAEAVAAWKKGLEYATKSKRDVKRKASVEKKIKALR